MFSAGGAEDTLVGNDGIGCGRREREVGGRGTAKRQILDTPRESQKKEARHDDDDYLQALEDLDALVVGQRNLHEHHV